MVERQWHKQQKNVVTVDNAADSFFFNKDYLELMIR